MALRPHTRYRLSAWVRTRSFDKGSGFGVQLNLHQLQMEGKSEALDGDHDWTQLVTEFDSGGHTELLVNLLFGGWGRSTGEAWFDDVELVDLTPALPHLSEEEQRALFEDRVQPLLEEHCWRCHGGGSRVRANLHLTSREGLLRGGDSGPAVDLDEPRNSLLLSAVNYQVYEMPPSGKLPQTDIDVLAEWVRRGAPWYGESEAPPPPAEAESGGPTVNEETRAHWSFQSVGRPSVPQVEASAQIRGEVDAFIAQSLNKEGLTFAPPAPRAQLVRRLYYGLTGLPPSPDEVRAFLEDSRPDAYERLVEELLDSPHYGEHWGRKWLDLVRYAESNSFERDGTKPFVWRYRDYVLQSFQNDKPYDRFLTEQLAGDELPEVTPETIIATGYYRIGQWDDEPADPKLALFDDLDDILATTSQSMLGLTMNCARCHEHKLDPMPQEDYYRFLAFFRGIRRYGVRSHESVVNASVRPIVPAEEIERHRGAVDQHRRDLRATESRLQEIATLCFPDFEPVEHEEYKHERNRVALVERRAGRVLPQALVAEYRTLTRTLHRLRSAPPPALAQALCVKESGPEPPATHVLIRGNPHVEGDVVEPGFPSVFGLADPEITPAPHGDSSGRRTALAAWITDPNNPLTARVMVNRIWQGHFGQGFVRSPNNFGLQGEAPSHPELLDWLAAEFVASGWSIKTLHRKILLSTTYRQAATPSPLALDRDPQNLLLSHFPMRRLSAEEVRDSILAVNSQLRRERQYGPSIYTKIPAEVLAGQSRPGDGWGHSSEEDVNRRSVYIHVKRSLIDPLLAAFDFADTDFTCPIRFTTTQPTQALTMINSEFLHEQAARFAADLERCHPGDLEAQVRTALFRTLQRPPSSTETERGLGMIAALQEEDGASPERARQLFCLMTLNLDEFLFLD